MDTTKFGTRTFNVWQNQCYSPYAPLKNGEPTYIDITHKNHDINLINKSWLNVTFEMDWSIDERIVFSDRETTDTIPKMFVGWKNAAEAIRRIEVYNDEKFTGYIQPDNQTDTFVQFTKYVTREDKRENYTSHTLYKDAINGSHNVCGTYISMYAQAIDGTRPGSFTVADDLRNPQTTFPYPKKGILANTIYTHTFSINIPLSEIPALRYFREYPACFKPLTLKLEFAPEAMIWTPLVMSKTLYNDVNPVVADKIPKGFTQVGVKRFCQWKYVSTDHITTVDNLYKVCNFRTFIVNDLRVKSLTADIEGYNISDEGKMAIQQQYSIATPFVIPCLYTYARTFDGVMASRRYHIEFPMAVHNVKDIHLVFPTDTNQKTCFVNPMLKDFQLRINNVNYPDKALKTDETRFYKSQINGIHADLDYQNSMSHLEEIQTTTLPIGAGGVAAATNWYFPSSYTDMSSFIATIQVERDNEPGVFDGLETGDDNINIHLDGECIKGPTEQSYASNHLGADVIPPSPKIWFTSKTYWTLDTENGLVFHERGVPNY